MWALKGGGKIGRAWSSLQGLVTHAPRSRCVCDVRDVRVMLEGHKWVMLCNEREVMYVMRVMHV